MVQIAAPAAPQAPRIIVPGALPGGGGQRSAQLLRPGTFKGSVADPYQEFLNRIPDLLPGTPGVPAALFDELVPDPSVVDLIPQPHSIWNEEKMGGHGNARQNPQEDAWGSRRPVLAVVPLGEQGR